MDIMSQRVRRCLFGVALVAAITTYAEEPVGARPAASTNAPASSSWTIHEDVDAMTDERIVWIVATGEAVQVDGLPARPSLTMRRRGQVVEAIYRPGGAVHYRRGINMVTMRIDDGPAVEGRWQTSTTREALFYEGSVAGMARHLREGRVLRLRSQGSLGHIVTQSIPLDGFGAAWDALLAHDKPHDKPPKTPPETPTKSPQIPTPPPSSNPATGAQNPLP